MVDDEEVVTAGLEGTDIVINEIGLGTANIILTASDSVNQVPDEFTVRVGEEGDGTGILSTPSVDFTISPTLAESYFTIELSAEVQKQSLKLSLCSSDGQMHTMQWTKTINGYLINAQLLPEGIYIVMLSDGRNNWTGRIVKL